MTSLRELGDWIRSEQGRVPCLAVAAFIAYLIWVLVVPGPPAHRLTSELYNIIVPFVAAIAVWRTARHPALDQRTRQAWLACTIGFLALMAGDVIWFVYDYVIGQRPAVSVADALYLAYYPALLWGVLRFPTPKRSQGDFLKLWLDVGTVAVTGGAIIWYLVLDPQVDAGTSTVLQMVLSAAYPVGDLILLFAGATVLLHQPSAMSRRAIQMLTIAGVAMFYSDLVLSYDVVHTGAHEMGNWTDLGWQSAMLLWVLVAYQQRWCATRSANTVEVTPAAPFTVSFIPYVAVIVGFGLLVVAVQPYWNTLGDMVWSVLMLTALVLARQVVAVRENVRLVNECVAHEARFRSLVQNSSDVITVVDAQGTIQFMSPAVEQVFGWRPSESVGKHITEIVHCDDAAAATAFMDRLRSTEDPAPAPRSLIVRCLNQAGEWRSVETIATVMLDDPAIQGIVLNTRDVSERMALQAALAHQAYHDPLTQLANRSWFQTQVERVLEQSRSAPAHTAVFFLDLDNFKNINDTFGHAEGDRLLIEVASRLLNATRGSDTVARLGGDEFAVLVGRVTTETDLTIIAQRITNAMRVPFLLQSGEVFSTASMGIARGTLGATVDDLLRDADVAMYVNKRQRQGTYTIFEPTMHAQALARLELETDLRHALVREELTLHFQPIVTLADRQLYGVEALVRWRHPQRGLLLPGEFIALAEESGLILPLGRWVLMEACRQGVRWRSMLPAGTPFTISVNVSGRQLDQAQFVDDVAAALRDTGLPPEDLMLEVTESVIVRDVTITLRRLAALKALGIKLAIDDFGTGYSSLSFLQRFPVDVLKIDKAFIDASSGESGAALTQTIVTLGETLSLQTVAEGIEHRRQADALYAMGCGLAQGFYFSRPVQPEEIDGLIQQIPPVRVPASLPTSSADRPIPAVPWVDRQGTPASASTV